MRFLGREVQWNFTLRYFWALQLFTLYPLHWFGQYTSWVTQCEISRSFRKLWGMFINFKRFWTWVSSEPYFLGKHKASWCFLSKKEWENLSWRREFCHFLVKVKGSPDYLWSIRIFKESFWPVNKALYPHNREEFTNFRFVWGC